MVYMVAGYLIVWACSFGLIFSMVQRQRGIQRELDVLKDLAGDGRARDEA